MFGFKKKSLTEDLRHYDTIYFNLSYKTKSWKVSVNTITRNF